MKFIKMMKWLRKMNNFNSYLAILSALDSAPIRRLGILIGGKCYSLTEKCFRVAEKHHWRAERVLLFDWLIIFIPSLQVNSSKLMTMILSYIFPIKIGTRWSKSSLYSVHWPCTSGSHFCTNRKSRSAWWKNKFCKAMAAIQYFGESFSCFIV